ncbi:BTAD domain-containing putative transcriptional regulator [Nonomuraea sp. NPDC049269]|uniref:AfsR/SARP family transcriptional regulator n=1 Tax=Nonomuraea sp. NPDC049269 TaxID=3364349 RepID=UPI0037111493
MKVGLLGPLEIIADDGAAVELPGRKPRVLMAVLACRANRPVSPEVLVDSLWGPTPPRQAEASLRVYVHHLRRAVGTARIDRRTEGYVLRLAPDEFDVDRFRALVTEGRRAVSAEEPVRAGELFHAALDLWRGPALAGLQSAPVLAADAASMEELRLQTLEQRFEVELALGRHDGIVAELRGLISQHPLRETFPGQLMRALAAGGRSAEAAAAFEATRVVLADELGLEPSPQLRQLHLSILRDDSTLQAAAEIGAPVPSRPEPARALIPRQLPAPVARLAGRAASLAELDALIPTSDGAMPIAAIGGAGGIGKTALAVHWAHRVQDRFPDGQLYANLHGFDPAAAPKSPSAVLQGFLAGLGVPAEQVPDGLEAQVNLYRTLLAERRVLVVLDNARDAEQVRPLLPGAPGCLVVVTSRNKLVGLVTAEGARPMTLNLLSVVEAHDLLSLRLGVDRLTSDPSATEQLIESCAGLPLALSIVAARLATNPNLSLTAVADELTHTRERLDLFAGDDAATDVRTVFSWSYQILGEDAARLFRLAGLHSGPEIAIAAVANLTGRSSTHVRPLITQLARMHLLIELAPGRFAFHDLLRAYAAELAGQIDSERGRRAALQRLLDHYLHTTHAATVALQHTVPSLEAWAAAQPGDHAEEFTGSEPALTWLVTERASLVAAIAQARDNAFFTHCWQLASLLQDFLALQGHWHDLRQVQQLALDAAERAADPAAQAMAHRALAYAETLFRHHQLAEHHLRRALALYRRLGDPVHEAYCHHNLDIVFTSQGRRQDALESARQALEGFRHAGDQRGEAIALNALGWIHVQAGEYEQALVYSQRALAIPRHTRDWQCQASILDTIAGAHHHLAQYQLAQDYYREVVDLCQQVGNRHDGAVALAHLGDSHDAAGEPELARDAWQQALDIIETLDHQSSGLGASDGYKKLPDVESLRAKLGPTGRATSPAGQPRRVHKPVRATR